MKLLPRDRFSIQTPQPLSAVIATLESHIEAPRIRWGFSHDHPPYTGTLSDSGFEIRRIIHYRNSFLPQIKGRFETTPQGTLVHITMGLHPVVMVFMLVWCSIWCSTAVPVALAGTLTGEIPPGIGLLFLGAPVAMPIIFGAAFWYEAKRSRRELTQIIQGRPLVSATASRIWRRTLKWVAWAFFTANFMVLVHQNFLVPGGSSRSIFASRNSPPLQVTQPCQQSPSPSPYCEFAPVHTLTEHPAANHIALSEDGKTLVSGGSDKAIAVWDLATGALQQTLQSDSGVVTALTIAPDGHTIVSGAGDRMVRIWAAATPDPYPQILRGHTTHDISHVQLAADGKTILSGGYGEVYLWDSDTGEHKATLPETGPDEFQIGPVTVHNSPPYFRLLDISADSKKLLVETSGRLQIWDVDTHQQTKLPRQWFTRLASAHFSPDGQTVVTTAYTQPNTYLKFWDVATGEAQADILLSRARESWGYGDRLAVTRDRVFVSTSTGCQVWNLQTGELEAVLDIEPLSQLVVSPDGKQLIGLKHGIAPENAAIQIWQRP